MGSSYHWADDRHKVCACIFFANSAWKLIQAELTAANDFCGQIKNEIQDCHLIQEFKVVAYCACMAINKHYVMDSKINGEGGGGTVGKILFNRRTTDSLAITHNCDVIHL